jgi:hypothetical protein
VLELDRGTCLGPFEYPSRPFNTGLDKTLAMLPGGVTELGLRGALSVPVIKYAARITNWRRRSREAKQEAAALEGDNRMNAAVGIRFWQTLPLNFVERLFILGCVAHCVMLGRNLHTWWATQVFVQMVSSVFSATPLAPGHDEPALMVWTARQLEVTYGRDNPPWKVASQLLAYVAANHPYFTKQQKRTLSSFFWDVDESQN